MNAKARYALSATQGVFEASRFTPDQGLNVEQLICRNQAALNLQAFRRAWQTVLGHNPDLRVAYKRDSRLEAYQEVHSSLDCPVKFEDCSEVPTAGREAFLADWLERDRQINFVLSEPPLMRLTVFPFSDDAAVWVWTFHHILLDGRAFFPVLEDFFATYEAYCAGRSVNLPKRIPFADFIVWYQEWLRGQGEAAASFWRGLYTGEAPAKAAMRIRRKYSPAHHRQGKIQISVAPETVDALPSLAAESGVTINTIVQGTWALLLSRYYDTQSITFCTIRACRRGSIEGTDRMTGLFMNGVPVHARIEDSLSVLDFLRGISRQQLDARAYQWTPASLLQSSIPASASKQFTDSCVLYERYDIGREATARFGGNGLRTFELQERANIPLLLSVSERPRVEFVLRYQSDLFAVSDMEQLGGLFSQLLTSIVRTPNALLGSLLGTDAGAIPVANFEDGDQPSASAQRYWHARLDALAIRPALPMSVDPSGIPDQPFTRYSGRLSASQWQCCRKHIERMDLSPSVFFLTAFADILSLWCNQRHFTMEFECPRREPAAANSAGGSGNPMTRILLEINLRNPDFPARAKDLMRQFQSDMNHSSYDLAAVRQAMLNAQLPDVGETPTVCFSSLLTESDTGYPPSHQARSSGGVNPSDEPTIWLKHEISEHADCLDFNWDAMTQVFPPGLIEAMFTAYQDYLQRLCAGSLDKLGDIRPELPVEQRVRREHYNKTELPYAPGLLHAGFFEMSRRQPDEIAVDDPRRQVRYGELAEHALSLACRLRDAHSQSGSLVAVVMEKGWEQLASVLGILRAGCAYLPIDPALPKARLEYLLTNAGASIVLTQTHLESTLDWPDSVRVWQLEGVTPNHLEVSTEPEPTPDSLAYVIYTSGSTGVPKGVMMTHRAAMNTVADINRRLSVSMQDRVLSVSALNFDLSVYDIFGILGCGGTVVLPDWKNANDPIHWLERIRECGVTIWNSAPALMQMLVKVLEYREETLPKVLRWALLSGDWIPVDLPGRLSELAADCRLLSLGGATEAAIWSIYYPVERVDPDWASIPYGMPLANQSIHVLNDRFEPCPEWTSGEIYIGGIGLALGYWEEPVKTAESFIRSPLSGDLLYRTGDYGRFHPEGYVEFLGRRDTQVKIRGHRIEMGEIEASLLRHPQIREAAVAVLPSKAGEKSSGELFAYVVLHPHCTHTAPDVMEAELSAHLASLLPAYMIPARIMILDKLPLSPNGKVDRRALLRSVPEDADVNSSEIDQAPTDFLEKAIWTIWHDMFPHRRIRREDRFYDLGGDSLAVLDMLVRVEKVVGQSLGLRPMRNGGTIAEIAAAVRRKGPVVSPSLLHCVQPGKGEFPFFFAHGDYVVGGLYCQRICARLGAQQPFYALDPHGVYGGELPLNFEEVAAHYVKLIRDVQPAGPYFLGGFCNGATAMYEVAQQLMREGETVATLVMLDPPDLYFSLLRQRISEVGKRLGLSERQGRNIYRRMVEAIEIYQYDGFRRLFRVFSKRICYWLIKIIKPQLHFRKIKPISSTPDLNFYYYELIATYTAAPYAGLDPVWIILRRGQTRQYHRQVFCWSGVIPHARFELVSGTHLELQNSMDEISGIIKTALETAQTTVSASGTRSDGSHP